MAAYHVFIDGAVDETDAGTERLAQAIADHYGLPVDHLRARIASGRFRVKGNCDRATAESYVSDLTRLGATCSIEEASPLNQSLTPLPFPSPFAPSPAKPVAPPVARTATQPLTRPSAPIAARTITQPQARSSTDLRTPSTGALGAPAHPGLATTPASQYQSGLAAAFAGETPDAQLGALAEGEAAFTLASIDGSDDAPPPPSHAFAPPDVADASSHPGVDNAMSTAHTGERGGAAPDSSATDGSAAGEPIDLFAPPEAAEAALSVDLAPEEEERAARKRKSAALEAVAPADPPASAGRYTPPALVAPSAPAPERRTHPLANERIRFVLGVVAALLIGFLPAHIIASIRMKSAFADIDAKVVAAQTAADSAESYAALDQFRATQLERKHDDRQGIAIMALFIWGATGGAVAYVWFRRIPWERFAEPV